MKVKVHTSFVGQTGYNAHAKDFFTELSKIVKLKIRNFTVGNSWKGLSADPHEGEKYLTDYQKSIIGEQTVIGDKGFYDVEIYQGMRDIENYDIDLVLNETNHQYFYDMSKFKGKFKIAYNVWESTRQPQFFFEQLLKFDQLWVPSEWQRQVSIEQGFPADRVFVVPEAVDSKIFHPDTNNILPDEYKNNRFKFIIFGRWDYRKATKEIIDTFLRTFDKSEPVDLIISVDNPYSVDGMKTTEERLEHYGFKDSRIKILNFLSREDYIRYLKAGHVFLSCARSEGWNLPLIEALACGTPSIYSDWGAQLQFAKGKGHPVKIIGEKPVGEGETYGLGKKAADESHGNDSEVSMPGNFCEPDFDDLSKVMRDVYVNYWEYKSKALKDSEIVRTEFSWENSAKIAKDILENINLDEIENKPIKPKVSIVTSFFNSENYVDEAIESVINQTFSDFEYIITDDFSQDKTLEKLKKWTKKDKRIKYVEQKDKQEIYWSPQKYANGDIIVGFDSDDVLLPKALEILVQMFDKNPEVIMIDANSLHYREEFKDENFVKPRFSKKYKFFENYLTYHKYYVNNVDYRFGETWGGLRSFRNVIDRNYSFKEDFDLKLGKHEDLVKILKFEELGKILYLGRVIHKVRERKDSNTKKTEPQLEFEEIWRKVEERRKTIELNEPTISLKYDKIWEKTYGTYYSSINYEKERKKISIINAEFSELEKSLFKEVYFDHDVYFDEISSEIDYYFINFYTQNSIEKILAEISNNIKFKKINITLQTLIQEAEPDLILKEGKLKKYLAEFVKYKWYIYADSYFFANFELEGKLDNPFVFLTGGDKKYLPLIKKCVESLNEFSEIPVVVYGFNCDVDFDYPNMIKRRIDKDRIKNFGDRDTRVYYYKIDASLDCIKNDPTKTYIWLDGDCIVTKNIDSIVNYKKLLKNYPLCMRYSHENLLHMRYISGVQKFAGHGDELGNFFKLKRNNNFTVATGLYMFDKKSELFFTEVLKNHELFLQNLDATHYVDDMALAEERLFNVLFWKYEYKNHMPITWISKDYFKINTNNPFVPKIKEMVDDGFDIMFEYEDNPLSSDVDMSKVLFYHGQQNPTLVEKKIQQLKKTNKLMIVAHPDDETIFGGGELLKEMGWKVVCVTRGDGDNNNSEIRKEEFKKVMSYVGAEYLFLDYTDDLNEVKYDESSVKKDLERIISEKEYDIILTHNAEGEYGHVIHKSIHNIVDKINPKNLYFFNKFKTKLEQNSYKEKMKLLSFYKSQNTDLPGFKEYLIFEGKLPKIENEVFKGDDDIDKYIEMKLDIDFNFDDLAAFVEIKSDKPNSYRVEFIDEDNGDLLYKTELKNNWWAATDKMNRQLNWLIKIYDLSNNELIFRKSYRNKIRKEKILKLS